MKVIGVQMKKIISAVLAFLIIFSIFPWNVLAQEIAEEVNSVEEQVVEGEQLENNGENGELYNEENTGLNSENLELNAGNPYINGLNGENPELTDGDVPATYGTGDVPTTYSDEESFKIALRWGGTSNSTYSWNATVQEEQVIKLTFYYQNEVTPKAYAPGDLVVTIPGIGNLNRSNTVKAIDIAADPYGAAEQKRDWSYKYNASTDTYTFYNNHEIEQGATFNGSFEMLYTFTARQSVNDYTQNIKATLTDGTVTAESSELTLQYTSKKDTFYINKTAKSLVSADGLSNYVEEGKTVSDYAWIQYTFRYNAQQLNARGLKNRYLIDTFPEGCVIAKSTNVIQNEDGTVSYKVDESTVSENYVREYSIIVGYPEEYVGQTIENTAYIYGTYYEEEEPEKLAESTVEVTLERIKNQVVGIVPGKSMSPDYIYREALSSNISFSASLYGSATVNSENEGYTVAITDDLLEIYTPENTESGKEAAYHTLTDDEYKFTSVTVPGKNSFTNANGYTLSDGDFTVKIYALYTENVNTRGLEEYTLIHEQKWGDTSIVKQIEQPAVAIRVEVSGLKESIKSFYISTRGTINVSENVANAVYENPSYIINYQFTELKDKDGNSLISDISEENYSQARLYERDSLIYGTGVLRAQDTIIIRETPPETPGYYYARSDIEPFKIDENVEYFTTTLEHYTDVNNRNAEEISKVEVYGVVQKEELETLIETLELTYSGLTFKNALSSDTDMQDYLLERATITQNGTEIAITFDFSDNPITSKNFSLGYTVDARLSYEEYYNSTNPTYSIATYAHLDNNKVQPQSTATYNEKTMAVGRDSASILLALASHQQLIKMVKTMYTQEFIQEDIVVPMNTEYTYRLKLRNGYNTLVNTEIIDILEHSELTVVDGENPYSESEWYGTFKNVDTTQIEAQGLGTKVYYANTLTPNADSWTLMENYENGIWTTTNQVVAIKVEIEGEIIENSIVYADVNMIAPNDETLEDKKAYNSYIINSDTIDLYTGMQSTYMINMPSNNVEVRLVEKEYNVEITKTDATSGVKLAGVLFGIYNEDGTQITTVPTGKLGTAIIKGLKDGTYIIKEEIVPFGYKKAFDELILTIQDGIYTSKERTIEIKGEKYDLTFTSTGDYAWTQNEDGTWQSNNYNINSSTTTMTSNEFTITQPGTISFDWSVSSESANFDYVYYTIKNVDNNNSTVSGTGTSTKIGGTGYGTVYDSLTFNNVTKQLEPGTYIIEFTYRKDGSIDKGLDRGFVKNVKVDSQVIEEKEGEIIGEATLEGNISTINLNIENERAKGSITIHKIDEYLNSNKEEVPLSGVEFELLNTEGTVIAEGTTDTDGNLVFENLDWGAVYVIKEKQAVQGYELLEENTYLSKLNKDKIIVLENIRKIGTAMLTKQDEVDGTKLEGAVYGLYAKNNIYDKQGNLLYEPDMLIEEQSTNAEGQAIFNNLIWGEYYIQEIETVYGYELSEKKYEFTISAETVETIVEITENEERSNANLQLIKIDEKGNFLPEVEFGLYTEAGEEVILTNIDRGEEVELAFTSEGDYAWTQNEDGTWQSNNYNVNSTTSIMQSNEFVLPQNGTISFDWSVSSQGTSYDYAYYTITNIETGETIGGTGTKIGGTAYGTTYDLLIYDSAKVELEAGTYKIEFTYYKNSSLYSGLDRAFVKNIKVEYDIFNITDTNGQLNIQGLEWGNYYLQEKKAPQGYELSDVKYSFTVDRETFVTGNNIISVVQNEETGENVSIIRNNRKKGKATLTKYACDAEGNETEIPLANAIYELYASNGTLIGEYTTDENGKIIVENLDWDSYYFLEKQAPEGYSISDKKISFVVNSKNADFEQELVAYNKQESGEIKINKTIPAESIYSAHGDSTFIFKIVGKDENGEEKVTLYRTITFTEQDKLTQDEYGNITKTITISDIEPYNYGITEEKNYRYELSEIVPVKNAEADNTIGRINLIQATENKGEISFVNNRTSNSLLTDNGLITNTAQNQYYVIGIVSELKTEQSYPIGTGLTSSDFKYTLLYSGGQEVEIEVSELEDVTINGGATYTETVIGNHIANIQATYNGKTYTTEIPIKWVMPSDYFTYRVLNTTEKTIAITGIDTKYTSPEVLYIPSEYNGYKVTQVAGNGKTSSNKLANIANVKNVQIEEGVTSIGNFAFYNCSSLTSIDLPSSVTSIGDAAFDRCSSLTSIDLPSSVTSIGNYAFRNCNSLTSVGEIPSSVTSIGDSAFRNCNSLTSIDLSHTQITSIGKYAFYECSSLTSVGEIPSSVTSIGDSAFRNCNSLTSIDLSHTQITSIGNSAFYGCSSLTSIDLPSSVTSIGDSAFRSCSSLTSINVSEDNKNYCSVDGVLYDKDKTEIICYPNGKKDIVEYVIPEGVTSIVDYAFDSCSSLTSIDLPSSVTSIGNYAFYGCSNLTSVDLSNIQITSIGNYAFYGCSSLTSVGEIPSSVTSIGDAAFDRCSSLTSIDLPSSVTSIGNYAFYECSSLTSVGEIPSSVTSIGDSAFHNCNSLTSIDLSHTQITSIGNYAFYECSSLTSVGEIPSSVTSIGDSAFYYCNSLTSIDLSHTQITSIGKYAFYYCSSLTSIDLPSSVTNIYSGAFYGCTNLTTINYHGTPEQFAAITVGTNNTPFTNATVNYIQP